MVSMDGLYGNAVYSQDAVAAEGRAVGWRNEIKNVGGQTGFASAHTDAKPRGHKIVPSLGYLPDRSYTPSKASSERRKRLRARFVWTTCARLCQMTAVVSHPKN